MGGLELEEVVDQFLLPFGTSFDGFKIPRRETLVDGKWVRITASMEEDWEVGHLSLDLHRLGKIYSRSQPPP